MKLNLTKSLENINCFDIYSNSYVFNNKVIVINGSVIDIQLKIIDIISFGKEVLLLDEFNSPYFVSDNNIGSKSEYCFRIGSLNFPYIYYYKKETPRKYGVFDYSIQKKLFETTEWIGRDIIDDYIFCVCDRKIIGRKVTSANPIWQFDLGSLGEYKPIFGTPNESNAYEVAKILGIWKDELLVSCEGGLILALSLNNGGIIRKWDVLPEDAEESIKDTFRCLIHQSGNVFQLNKSGDKILGLYYCHWVEICLQSGKITTKHLKETFDIHTISSFQTKSGYAEDETHLYSTVFLDQQKLGLNYMPTAVCALNKQTCQVDWLHRFDLDNTGDYVSIQVPQVANDKLYQLTQNNVLHIFEKE